jgi:O-antigen/teichoic acid export membrane protein
MGILDSETNSPVVKEPKSDVLPHRQESEEDDLNPAVRMLFGFLPGFILILLGGLFLLSQAGYLAGEWWQYFLVGMAVIVFLETGMRVKAAVPLRMKLVRIISAILLIAGGVLFLFDPNDWWPWVLIVIGIVSILLFLWARKREKRVKTDQKKG